MSITIEIGKSLVIGNGAASFAFLASEVKGKRPVDVAFPKSLMSALERYVDYYRDRKESRNRKRCGELRVSGLGGEGQATGGRCVPEVADVCPRALCRLLSRSERVS